MSRFFRGHSCLKTMAAYSVVGSLADINEQMLIGKKAFQDYEIAKTLRIATVGTFVVGPLVFAWIKFIEKRIPGKNITAIAKKVILEQTCFDPVGITSFYIATNILERKEDLLEEWKQKFWPTWRTGMMYWPIVQTINFKFIPHAYKTSIYMPCASLIWTTFLCYMKELNLKQPQQDLEPKSSYFCIGAFK